MAQQLRILNFCNFIKKNCDGRNCFVEVMITWKILKRRDFCFKMFVMYSQLFSQFSEMLNMDYSYNSRLNCPYKLRSGSHKYIPLCNIMKMLTTEQTVKILCKLLRFHLTLSAYTIFILVNYLYKWEKCGKCLTCFQTWNCVLQFILNTF